MAAIDLYDKSCNLFSPGPNDVKLGFLNILSYTVSVTERFDASKWK